MNIRYVYGFEINALAQPILCEFYLGISPLDKIFELTEAHFWIHQI